MAIDMTDQQAVGLQTREYVRTLGGNDKRLASLTQALSPGEQVMFFTSAIDGVNTVILGLTNQRIIIADKDPIKTVGIKLASVTSITGNKGLIHGDIRVEFAGNRRKFGSVPKKAVDLFIDLAQIAITEAQAVKPDLAALYDSPDRSAESVEANAIQIANEPYAPIALHDVTDREREAAYRRLSFEVGDKKIFVRGELKHLPNVMMPSELLLWMASGVLQSTGKEWRAGGFTLIVLTDRRLILLDKKILAGIQTIAIDLDKVQSITGDTGLIFGSIKIQDAGNERKIGAIDNDTVQPFIMKVQAAIEERKRLQLTAGQVATEVQPVAPVQTDVVSQLERLADLMDRGILTPEEFQEQKRKMLDG